MKAQLFSIQFVFFSAIALAQQQEQLLPAELKQKTVITEPVTLYKGFFRAGITASFISIDKTFDDNAKKNYSPQNAWDFGSDFSLVMLYGISNRLQVGALIPYRSEKRSLSVLYEVPSSDPSINSNFVSSWDLQGHGLGDIDLSVAYQAIVETDTRPALRSAVRVTLPTGEKNPTEIVDPRNYRIPMGYGEVKVDANLLLRKIMYPYSYTVGLHYIYHFPGEKIQTIGDTEKPFKSSDFVLLSGSFNFHLNDWIAIQNEVDYAQFFNNATSDDVEVDLPVWMFQYVPTLSFQIRRLRLLQSVIIPIAGRNTGADTAYSLIAQYTF